MRTMYYVGALSAAFFLLGAPGSADQSTKNAGVAPAQSPAAAQFGGVSTTAVAVPCEALNGMPQKVGKRKGGPIRKVLKGIASEYKADLKAMADDAIFVFSAQSMGPDETTSSTQPYQAYEITLMNGDMSSVTRFPDSSFRVNGGTFDGTCACRNASGQYTIYYPNGVQGLMKPLGGGSFEILRPDNSITTFKKSSQGGYRISNSKSGYAGEMTPDEGDVGWKLGPAGF